MLNWRTFEYSHNLYLFFFKVQNWDSQQRAETAAISNFEISSNLTIITQLADDMPETQIYKYCMFETIKSYMLTRTTSSIVISRDIYLDYNDLLGK